MPACHLATTSVITSTDSWPFQRETTVSDDDVESYQLPSHQLDLPLVLVQDSITGFELVDLEPIPQSIL
jgi:hypothetical protein